jgi:thymidylate synthase (FAD)
MLLVKPSAEILYVNTEALQLIETAGRVCYKSEDKITTDSAPKFVEMILKRGHESVIEHATATVRFICDRGVTHEIVRHRLASYSQESTRYCDYNGGHIAFVIPPWCDLLPGEYDKDSLDLADGELDSKSWAHMMLALEAYYKSMRAVFKWRPEQARSVLPNSLKTEIVMTANLREWRHFFKLRTSAAAHPQMREVAIPLLAEMKVRIPVIFDDLVA